MEKLEKVLTVFNKLKELRSNGVKMKDIADVYDITPSVLSSLYRTILPAYISEVNSGSKREEALDSALGQVNNISKRKFFELIDDLEFSLDDMDKIKNSNSVNNELFFDDLKRLAIKNLGNNLKYSGFYLGYSKSSYRDGLKIEPMMILPENSGEIMKRVACMNNQSQIYWGNALFSDHQISYLFFNEVIHSQLSLKVVYIQIPMFDSPKMIKGVYVTHDYGRNPIARRVVYIKQDDITIEEFEKLSTQVKSFDELNDQEQQFYTYTCEKGDYIRTTMASVSPEFDIDELIQEKKILDI